jgi:hypothetical protein
MRIRIGTIPSLYQKLPRFALTLTRPRISEKVFIAGRLYQGYVGLIWNTRVFDLTIWIYKPKGA